MIKMEHISFGYEYGKDVINDFSFEFEDNKSYTILGENGKGKTTLIKLILGMLKPTTGRIERKNVRVVGYVPLLSVEENGKEWSEDYTLEKCLGAPVKELSLGTKKKAALLCTLLTEPDVLVMDEPTRGLDQKEKEELIKILKGYRNKMTIITVTQDEFYINAVESNCIKL